MVIIGDIYHSRVVRSDVYGLTKLGADVSISYNAYASGNGKTWSKSI